MEARIMAKDDKGQSGEGGLDLHSLKYGTLNFIRDDSINDSGDRRRGNPLTFLAQTLSKAYSTDTLKGVKDFRGIVMRSDPKEGIVPVSRSEILNAFLHVSLGGKILKALTRDKKVYAYKVYIPEIEMRPPPVSAGDPILDTYFDVYDSRVFPEEKKEIAIGTVVTVVFEDFKNLLNPQIIASEKKPLIIKGLTEGASGLIQGLKSLFSGSPDKSKVGDEPSPGDPHNSDGEGAASPFSGDVPRHPDDAPLITRMSDSAREKKRRAEGTVLTLYNDPYGLCTIGKGHLIQGTNPETGKNFRGPCSEAKRHGLIPQKWLKGGLPPDGKNTRAPSHTMTEAQAEALFIKDIEKRERQLAGMLRSGRKAADKGDVRVTQNQFDALMSAVYNSGGGNVRKYIIRPYLKKGDWEGAVNAFTVYNQMGYRKPDHERYLAGLNRLREKERKLFATA
jgi:GH24 family phage-related lysozyme (muramidase)